MEIAPRQCDPLACLDQSPREALRLAQEAYDLACASENAHTRAESALTLAIVLNTLGEFQDALPLCDFAAVEFSKRGENDQSMRALCEAAWACSFLGKLGDALETVTRVRKRCGVDDGTSITQCLASNQGRAIMQARCDWIQARILRDQGHYPEAQALLRQVRARFQSAHLPLGTARCERELARTLLLGDQDAAPLLPGVRQTFVSAHCPLDVALCDYLTALSLQRRNHYPEAIQVYLSTRQRFAELGASWFAAWCDLELGICYRQLNRFDESLRTSHQARDYFLSHGARAEASGCAINLANTYYSLNRYDEALPLYQEAVQFSMAEGRRLRTSLVNENMALVYAQQGLFSKALDLHQRALQMFVEENQAVFAAISQVNLASAYRQLGQSAEALEHLRQARVVFAQQRQWLYLAECDLELAEVHLAVGEAEPAAARLAQARAVCVNQGLASLVAVCDRLLAQIASQKGEQERAFALIANSRATFLDHAQIVDAALCDLAEGELRLQGNQVAPAQECFLRARATLTPGFPDQVWRADYGIGRCAALSGDPSSALDHHLRAVRAIAQSRSMLVTEQLSNDFFGRYQSVYADALAMALRQNALESALAVIEASKARTCLTLLHNRGWKLRGEDSDAYVAGLIRRERDLRYQLGALRQRVALQTEKDSGEPLRGAQDLAAISANALQELNALSQAYESVVSQLRLAATGLVGVAAPPPFALAEFRHAANAAFGSTWAALDYYFTDDALVILIVCPDELKVESKRLSAYDHAVLDKCASAEPDLRELIYRGTLRGTEVPSPGVSYLRHLDRLLIPAGLGAETLIIAPHHALHALPFHALKDADTFLLERHTLVYTPSLQVMQLLLADSRDVRAARPLVLGLSHFEEPLRALPAAAAELDVIRHAFAGRGEFLWAEQATRQTLLDLDASGELQKFDLVHFAAHALFDRAAPHQSRVVLADGALTALDVLDLSLNARLVTLSACQTALGKGGPGDEWIGLVRAFFYAGARALVASLWHVEDHSLVEWIEQFYRHLAKGESTAASLRSAQIEMIRAGHPPYRWAPFIFIGRP